MGQPNLHFWSLDPNEAVRVQVDAAQLGPAHVGGREQHSEFARVVARPTRSDC